VLNAAIFGCLCRYAIRTGSSLPRNAVSAACTQRQAEREQENSGDKISANPRKAGMKFRQAKHQDQRTRESQYKPGESPQPRDWSNGHGFANGIAHRFDSRIHEHRIVDFKDVLRPGRDDHLSILHCS